MNKSSIGQDIYYGSWFRVVSSREQCTPIHGYSIFTGLNCDIPLSDDSDTIVDDPIAKKVTI